MLGIYDLLEEAVRSDPDRTALKSSGGDLTYAELERSASLAAASFETQGIGPGDVVALWTDNNPDAVVAILGLARIGAVTAPLNPTMTDTQANLLIDRVRPDAVLLLGAVKDPFGHNAALQRVRVSTDGLAQASSARPGPHDPAVLLFTAGSTAVPKTVPLTHRNIVASITAIRTTYRLSSEDTTLLVMPVSHGHGLIGGLLATLASGGTVVLPRTGRFSAHTFQHELKDAKATWYTASPTMHRIALLHSTEGDRPTLRFVRTCSEAMPQQLASQLSDAFHAPVIPAYGLTEASHQVSSNPLPQDGPVDFQTVGVPTADTVSIRTGDGEEAATDVEGEIWVTGPTVTDGYRGDPEGTAVAFVAQWLRTGDIGSLDHRGYLTITGRVKDIINRGGEKIAPEEIEDVLAADPTVCAAVAFGASDPIYGEHVEAAVVPEPGTTIDPDQLISRLQQALPAAAIPLAIHVVDELPLTSKGTIDRRGLAKRLADTDGKLS
ncbi:MAG TPA: AMP-binding protein [Galbitalea sp.]